MIRPLAIAAILLTATPAIAAPCQRATAVATGATVPCDGVLWPRAWSAEAVRMRVVVLPTVRAEAAHAAAQAAADLASERARSEHAAVLAAAALAEAEARAETWRRLAQTRMPPPEPWRGWPWVALGVGVVVGAGGVYAVTH